MDPARARTATRSRSTATTTPTVRSATAGDARASSPACPATRPALRLTAARRAITAAALWTDVFVPPRWLASDGTVAAAAEQGFRVLADESERSTTCHRCGRARPGAAARERPRWGGVAWVLRRGGPVRIHVRAKDLRRPGRAEAVLAAIDAALGHVTPTTYGRPTRRVA